MINSSWKAYFLFSEKEIKGILVLGFILLGSILMTMFLPQQKSNPNLSKLSTHDSLFIFDPNTIDSQNALLLGIPAKQVSTLLKYRNKGGYFRQANDFTKLYGLKPALIEKLLPFIKINPQKQESIILPMQWNRKQNSFYHLKGKDTAQWTLDLNTATEGEWQEKTSLPLLTIRRIIAYRNYLGAFTRIGQINRVYGLNEAEYQTFWKHLRLKPQDAILINANTMQFDDWKHLGIFTDRQIWTLLKLKKEQGGRIGWRALAEACDLTQEEVERLRKQIRIDD